MQDTQGQQPVSFHRRVLPPSGIAFASTRGREVFAEALANGTLHCFFKLIEQFCTQAEPAYCGLGTLVMVLNALDIDPGRTWKGPWRWFHEGMLDCCEPLEDIRRRGITFDKLACLARCNGAVVDARRANASGSSGVVGGSEGGDGEGSPSLSDEERAFREAVRSVCSGDNAACCGGSSGRVHRFLVVSYSRREFGQTGDGHFSPVGGYHAGSDSVLLLDVARFKYPPHWVGLRALWRALCRTDPDTGKTRGYLLLSARKPGAPWPQTSRPPTAHR